MIYLAFVWGVLAGTLINGLVEVVNLARLIQRARRIVAAHRKARLGAATPAGPIETPTNQEGTP